MKIHSSSLASIPARYKANNHNEAQKSKAKKNEDELQNNSPIEHRQPTIQAKDNLKQVNLLHIAKPLQNAPVNSRIHQALNAYIQETNQPLKNQRSELITGIDFFV